MTRRVFLSHAAADQAIAEQLKRQLEDALVDVEVFVSSAGDIPLGAPWLAWLTEAVQGAAATLALCTPHSVGRPWVHFESGAAWARTGAVITVCVGGTRRATLPTPLGIFQGIDLYDRFACEKLVRDLATQLAVAVRPDFDATAMFAANQTPRPAREPVIGIVRRHKQEEWQPRGARVPFDFPTALPAALADRWRFEEIDASTDVWGRQLQRLSGVILGMPWRHHMPPDDVQAFVEWVYGGGRLLLLGYELGDRHHGGNLGELTRRFGIHLATDIVAPTGHDASKPFGEPVTFRIAAAESHPLTAGLDAVRLVNAQTLSVEPVGVAWLRVGQNMVYRPTRQSVVYRDGTLTQPKGQTFDVAQHAADAAVAVQAPLGLCGSGGVHAIGTWDLLDYRNPIGELPQDNVTLLERLLDWLAGDGAVGVA